MKESVPFMIEIQIRTLNFDDWERVRSIYLDGIATGQAGAAHARRGIPRLPEFVRRGSSHPVSSPARRPHETLLDRRPDAGRHDHRGDALPPHAGLRQTARESGME